jgi:membrane protease YdiL (CAAX protease family)
LLRRIVAFPLTLLVLGTVWMVGLSMLLTHVALRQWTTRDTPGQALGALVVAAGLVLAWKAWKRWIEREPDRELALPGAAGELGIVALLGGLEVLGFRGMGNLWAMVAMAVMSGTFEEILFRGVMLRQFERLVGTWLALGITAMLFGAVHLANPGASLFAGFAIAIEAGILLGAAYLVTRRLWLAIGLHAGWNFTQGWVFSVPVSGGEAPLGLLVTRRVGPDWLTGGDFGLEASAVAMVVATLAGLLLLRRAALRGEVRPPPWRRPD